MNQISNTQFAVMQSSIRSLHPSFQKSPVKEQQPAPAAAPASQGSNRPTAPGLLLEQQWKNQIGKDLVFNPRVNTYSKMALDNLQSNANRSNLAS